MHGIVQLDALLPKWFAQHVSFTPPPFQRDVVIETARIRHKSRTPNLDLKMVVCKCAFTRACARACVFIHLYL